MHNLHEKQQQQIEAKETKYSIFLSNLHLTAWMTFGRTHVFDFVVALVALTSRTAAFWKITTVVPMYDHSVVVLRKSVK